MEGVSSPWNVTTVYQIKYIFQYLYFYTDFFSTIQCYLFWHCVSSRYIIFLYLRCYFSHKTTSKYIIVSIFNCLIFSLPLLNCKSLIDILTNLLKAINIYFSDRSILSINSLFQRFSATRIWIEDRPINVDSFIPFFSNK